MQANSKSKSQELANTPTNDSVSSQVDQPTAAFKPDPMAETYVLEGEDSTHLWSSAGHIVSANDVDLTATFDTSATSVGQQKATQKVIGGYEILGELGRGGMGVVYKAYQRGLKRTVALKMILGGGHAGPEQLKRFLTEAHSVAHLQHPNIVQVFDIGENNGLPYFSLEFIDGPPLSEKLGKNPQPPREAAEMVAILAMTIAYAHEQGILHRDLKPANILLTSAGVPKIADFGLAKQIEEAETPGSTRTGTIMGTASYMSPEQALGDNLLIGPATDQYALGAVLYEMLTGRPPFVAARRDDVYMQVLRDEPLPLRQLEKQIPADLETICLKALQKDIGQRYSSCKELAEDIGRFLRGEPILARPVSVGERVWRWCKRNPIVASLSAAALSLLFAIAIGSSWTAAVLSAKNADLAKQTKLANDNATKATDNANEATRRSDRMKVYIQDVIKDLLKVDIYDNPRMRNYVENALEQMLPILSEIVGELPETDQAAPTRASGLSLIAKGLQEKGKVSEAQEKLQELVEFGEKRLKIKGNSDAARLNLSKFLRDLAVLQLESNRNFPKHFELLYRAEALAQDVIDHPSSSPDDNKGLLEFYQARVQLAEVKKVLATANYRNGDPMKARELFDESTRLYKEVLAAIPSGEAFEPKSENPLSEEDKKTLPITINGYITNNNLALSSLYFRTGEPQRAEKILTQVVAVTRQSFDADPTLPSKAMQYVGYLGVFSEIMIQSSDPRALLQKLEEATTIADRFYQQDTRNAEKRRRTALAHYRVGQWREMLGIETAQESFQRCLALRLEAASLDASNDRKQLDLMLASAAVGDAKKSHEIVDKYLVFPLLDNEMRIDIARALARLSSKVAAPEDIELRSRAVNVLESAVKCGYKDHVFLSSDLDLRVLQQVPEFEPLIKSLR